MASSVHVVSNYDNVVLLRPGVTSGQQGEEEELDDIISEIRDIDSEGGQTDEPSDDELNKTPDGESNRIFVQPVILSKHSRGSNHLGFFLRKWYLKIKVK